MSKIENLLPIKSNYNGQIPSKGRDVEVAFNENFEKVKSTVNSINDIIDLGLNPNIDNLNDGDYKFIITINEGHNDYCRLFQVTSDNNGVKNIYQTRFYPQNNVIQTRRKKLGEAYTNWVNIVNTDILNFPELKLEVFKDVNGQRYISYILSRTFTDFEKSLNPKLLLMRRKRRGANIRKTSKKGHYLPHKIKWNESTGGPKTTQSKEFLNKNSESFIVDIKDNSGDRNIFPFSNERIINRFINKEDAQDIVRNLMGSGSPATIKKNVNGIVHAQYGIAIRYDNPHYDGPDRDIQTQWNNIPSYIYSNIEKLTFTLKSENNEWGTSITCK